MPSTTARTDTPASDPTGPVRERTLRGFFNRLSTIIASAHRAGVPF